MAKVKIRVIDAYVYRKTKDGIKYLILKRAKTKMYEHLWQGVAGKIEKGEKKHIFNNPMHPYTHALLSSVPVPDPFRKKIRTILPGEPPNPISPPSGCSFHPSALSINNIRV